MGTGSAGKGAAEPPEERDDRGVTGDDQSVGHGPSAASSSAATCWLMAQQYIRPPTDRLLRCSKTCGGYAIGEIRDRCRRGRRDCGDARRARVPARTRRATRRRRFPSSMMPGRFAIVSPSCSVTSSRYRARRNDQREAAVVRWFERSGVLAVAVLTISTVRPAAADGTLGHAHHARDRAALGAGLASTSTAGGTRRQPPPKQQHQRCPARATARVTQLGTIVASRW